MVSENTWDTEEGQNGGNKDDGTIHWERLWIQDDDKEELDDGFLRIVTTFSFSLSFLPFFFFFFFFFPYGIVSVYAKRAYWLLTSSSVAVSFLHGGHSNSMEPT